MDNLIALSTNSYADYRNAAMRELRMTKMPSEPFDREYGSGRRERSYLAARHAAENAAYERTMDIAMGELSRVIATTRRLTQISTEPGFVTPNIQVYTTEPQQDPASRVRFRTELESEVARRVIEALYLRY